MSSGVWLPAEQVVELSSMAMRGIINDVQMARESTIASATQTKWSWRKFRYVDVPAPPEVIENAPYIGLIDHFLENPFSDKTYTALSELSVTAIIAEQLVPGGQIFVSTEDFSPIAPFIDGKERYDAVHPSVPDPGDHSD